MLWHIELKFCTWLCFNVLQSKFECRPFVSIFEGVRPLLELRTYEIHSFLQFSPACSDILRWNFAHDFVLMYYRASSSVVTLRPFLKELCLFVNLEYRKCAVFRTFLLHSCFQMLSWIFAHYFVLRLYKTPTREKILSFKRHETCPVYTRRCILWIKLIKSNLPESIFEYCTSKVGYPSDLSKYSIWFHLRS